MAGLVLARSRWAPRCSPSDGRRSSCATCSSAATGGFDDDGVVTLGTAWLVRWHSGAVSLAEAQRAGGMTVVAAPWLVRELAGWGRLSPFAGVRPDRGGAVRTS